MMRTLLLLLAFSTAALAQTAGLSTVRVYSYSDADRLPDGYGSGWLIEKNKIVTAAHVIRGRRDGPQQVKVRFIDGYKAWAAVLAVDEKYDIALLQIVPHKTITELSTKPKMPEVGKAGIHGYGYDFEYHSCFGWLAGGMEVVEEDDKGFLPTKPNPDGEWVALMGACAFPGDSGGPVTMNGEVVGSVLATNPQFSILCPIDLIKKQFSDHLTPRKQP